MPAGVRTVLSYLGVVAVLCAMLTARMQTSGRTAAPRKSYEFDVGRDHARPASPMTEAKTATGESCHFDGRILVLVLKSSAASGRLETPISSRSRP